MRLKTSTLHVFRALKPRQRRTWSARLQRQTDPGGTQRRRLLLLVSVQGGLQEAEGVHQSRGKAALLSWRPPEPRALHRGPVQVKLLLRLFADQVGLQTGRDVESVLLGSFICHFWGFKWGCTVRKLWLKSLQGPLRS